MLNSVCSATTELLPVFSYLLDSPEKMKNPRNFYSSRLRKCYDWLLFL